MSPAPSQGTHPTDDAMEDPPTVLAMARQRLAHEAGPVERAGRERRVDPVALTVVGSIALVALVGFVLLGAALMGAGDGGAPADGPAAGASANERDPTSAVDPATPEAAPSPGGADEPSPPATSTPAARSEHIDMEGLRSVLEEDWSTGLDAWTGVMGNPRTSCPASGPCQMLLEAQGDGDYTRLERYGLDVEADRVVVLFGLRPYAEHESTDTDAGFQIGLGRAGAVSLGWTQGIVPNTGLALTVAGPGGGQETFGHWERSGVTHRVALELDLSADRARAQVTEADGQPTWVSPWMDLPEGAQRVESLSFWTVSWDEDGGPPHVVEPLAVLT